MALLDDNVIQYRNFFKYCNYTRCRLLECFLEVFFNTEDSHFCSSLNNEIPNPPFFFKHEPWTILFNTNDNPFELSILVHLMTFWVVWCWTRTPVRLISKLKGFNLSWCHIRLSLLNAYWFSFTASLLQKFYTAVAAHLQWCRYAHHGPTLFLQVCNGARSGRAHVPLPEEHIPGPAADSGCPPRKNSSLW